MDEKKELTLGEMFAISDASGRANTLLTTGRVVAATVETAQQAIAADVALDALCEAKVLHSVERQIAVKYHLKKITLCPKYPLSLLDDAYFAQLAAAARAHFPAVNGYLHNASWKLAGQTLCITLAANGAQFIQPCIAWMKQEIAAHFGVQLEITLEENGFDEHAIAALHEKMMAEHPAPPPPAPKKPSVSSAPAPRRENGFSRAKRLQTVEGEVLLGKAQMDEITPMSELNDEFGKVSVEGDVFYTDHKENLERQIIRLKFDITDYTGSIKVTKVLPLEEGQALAKAMEPGAHVKVHGITAYDMYIQDTVLKAQNIVKCEKKIRMDQGERKRVELHMHTNMSSMDGMSSASALMGRAAAWGHPAVAITDHGVVQAYPEAMNAAAKLGIKPIYGVEAYFINNEADVQALKGVSDEPLSGEFVCFDLETTGLNAATDGITEIAATVLRGGELCEEYHTYVDPQRPIPEKITQLTGISNETVRGAPLAEEAVRDFLKFVNGRVLVAHNADFDIGFLRAACSKFGIKYDFVSLDTLAMARILLPNLDRHRLNLVATALSLPKFQHHRAGDDAATVAYMLVKFFEMMQSAPCHTQSLRELNLDLSSMNTGKIAKVRPYHLIILVKNYVGLKNLYKLVSLAHLKYYQKRPIIPRTVLDEYREGLILGSACEAGELYTAIVQKKAEAEIEKIAKYYDFLEIQPVGNNAFMVERGMVRSLDEIRDFNRKIVALGEKLGLPVAATGDVHFLEPHDEVYRRILMAGMGFSDADNQAPLYLKTTDEMLEEFSYLGREKAYEVVVENTNRIADWCEEIRPIPKEQFPPSIEGSKDDLINMCRKRAHELYGDPLPEIVNERLEYELEKITTHGFDVMYIIAQKLVCRSIEEGYLVGSRGSVGSSVVAYFSGITEVNALPPHYRCPNCKHAEFMGGKGYSAGVDMPDKTCPNCGTKYQKDGFDIPFATFLGFDGDKTPDIDLNFSGEYQSRAHRHTIEIFGEGHVFRAGTIGTIAEKTAYGFVKKYLDERGKAVSKTEQNRMTVGCTGIKRTTGQHPGGVMIVPMEKEIYDFTPVQHPADDKDSDIITTHFDYHSIHDNILKLDLLGHDDPTIIRMLEDMTGLNAREIPLDDPETMSIFISSEALGIGEDPILGVTGATAIPEFGTKFVRGMLVDTHPTTFDELVRISGLSHGTDVWLNNAQTLVQEGTATLKEAICCRDDIMLYLISKNLESKLAFTIMESVRKGKGLKPEWEEEMRAHDVPEWYIESCKKIKYMFPKAHAVAYVMMAFRIAWFKVHEPRAFYAAYFSIRAKAFDASIMTHGDEMVLAQMDMLSKKEKITAAEKDMLVTLEVCHEFYLRGFTFDPIDLYESHATKFLITEHGLRPPFTAIPGLGEVAACSMIEERQKGKFLSMDEIQMRCNKVSKAVIELLEQNGALGDLPRSSQMSFF